MESILVKIFATAFALSEVLTHPGSVRTHLDPTYDQDKVVRVLRAGCDHMRRAFDIETINIDDLITTALDDSEAFGANAKAFHGIQGQGRPQCHSVWDRRRRQRYLVRISCRRAVYSA